MILDLGKAMTRFRYAVNKSTLTEGITVPKALEGWIDAPALGQKRQITLIFGETQVHATLRRLNNARGHVQIKYENKEGLLFRQWLARVFAASQTRMKGEYVEFERLRSDVFRVDAFPVSSQPSQRLEISEWIFHRSDQGVLQRLAPVREIPAIIHHVEFKTEGSQNFYNRQMARLFADWNWQSERRIVPELPLRSDFVKGPVLVEVEFGNARTYYQDYVKFLLASHYRTAEFGVLIVPTEDFARFLCEVGKRKAMAKGGHCYSGMIHLEKVRRELEFLKFMLPTPLVIAGIRAAQGVSAGYDKR
jgi:hypothetical protein